MAKKKPEIGDLVKNIFDPVLKDAKAQELSETDIFFASQGIEKKETSVVVSLEPEERSLEPEPSLPKRPPHFLSGLRILIWLATAASLIGATHLGLSFFEADARLRESQFLLMQKKGHAALLEEKLTERKGRERDLLAKLEDRLGQKRSLTENLQFLQAGVRRGRGWADLLIELSKLQPSGIWLKDLRLEKGKIYLQGYSLNEARVVRWTESLGRSASFEAVQIHSVEPLQTVSGMILSFSCEAQLSHPEGSRDSHFGEGVS